MPRVNLGRKEPDKFVVLVKGTASALGIETPELARKAGIGEARLYRRLKKPEEFTRMEMKQLLKALNIPVEEGRAVSIP